MMLIKMRVSLALLLGSQALAAILVQKGSDCTLSPGGATGGKSAKRAVETEFVEVNIPRAPVDPLHPPGSPGSLDAFPRPEPGTEEARHYDRKAAQEKAALGAPVKVEKVERVKPLVAERDESISQAELADADDTPQILDAFKRCGKDGSITFTEGKFNLRQVMNTSGLNNVDIKIYGNLVWSGDNIQYWLRNSFSVTYAGRSTAWMLSGTNISMRGYGKALFEGNGQIWMDQNQGQGNQNGRPISLTVWRANNVYIDGITWRMAQFWHTFVAHSQNVTMTNLDMYTWTDRSKWAVNTDGIDTWNSRDIVISNWTVTCGDDCISVKGNTTNFHASNIVCQESGCACIGSVGSNAGQPDFVDNVVFKNFTCKHSSNAAWIKTYPGSGHVRNVTFEDFKISEVDQPIYVTSCIYSNSGCDSSRLGISDVTWRNISGTSRYNVAAGIHCPSSLPCTGFKFENIDIKPSAGGTAKVLCANFNQGTSGLNCTGTCPAGWPQQLKGNR